MGTHFLQEGFVHPLFILFIRLASNPRFKPSICPSTCLSVRLSVCLSVSPSVRPSVRPSLYLSTCLMITRLPIPGTCPYKVRTHTRYLPTMFYPLLGHLLGLPEDHKNLVFLGFTFNQGFTTVLTKLICGNQKEIRFKEIFHYSRIHNCGVWQYLLML